MPWDRIARTNGLPVNSRHKTSLQASQCYIRPFNHAGKPPHRLIVPSRSEDWVDKHWESSIPVRSCDFHPICTSPAPPTRRFSAYCPAALASASYELLMKIVPGEVERLSLPASCAQRGVKVHDNQEAQKPNVQEMCFKLLDIRVRHRDPTSPFLVPSDSSELAAALPPVPTAGATPPFYGTNACLWAEAAGTQREREDKHIKLYSGLAAAGMPHALGRRAGGSAGVQRGVQAARVSGASLGRSGMGDTRVKAATADEREVRWMGECPRAAVASGGPAAWWLTNGVVGRGWRAVNVGYHCAAANHGCPVDRCSIYHNSFANFEVYLAVVAADDGEEV
ncbi:hypothetical protein B0H14DRAFT_3130655 [Mycena olivaceomarginata]|nr:hypothetical protein B0H14DRAFT_3130655 [Mycena olivaceomarginata]